MPIQPVFTELITVHHNVLFSSLQVVQEVLDSVAQHEAYYDVFNEFVNANPDILTEEYGTFTFLQKCKNLLHFNNKKKWFYLMLENMNFDVSSQFR